MDSGVRNRVRLWLRSERAMGLATVPDPAMDPAPAAADAPAGQDESIAPAAPAPAPATPVAAPRVTPAEVAQADPGRQPPRPAGRSDPLFSGVGAPNEMAPRGGLMPPPSREPFESPVLPTEQKRLRLAELDANEVKGCTRCRLCQTRTNTVFGEGDPDAKIVFIGEGPGENEDLQGRPFVGRAGEKLNEMIAAMGLRREQVFIANIVKCRPPGNRVPAPDEVATCTPYLERQIEIIRPKVIVTLGLPALKYMTGNDKLAMGKSRGHWLEWRGIRLMPTFHPAYILRSYTREVRAAVWSDLQAVMAELGMPVPRR